MGRIWIWCWIQQSMLSGSVSGRVSGSVSSRVSGSCSGHFVSGSCSGHFVSGSCSGHFVSGVRSGYLLAGALFADSQVAFRRLDKPEAIYASRQAVEEACGGGMPRQ
jgi:hypothetical protein